MQCMQSELSCIHMQVADALSGLVAVTRGTPHHMPLLQHLQNSLVQSNDYARKGQLMQWLQGLMRGNGGKPDMPVVFV